MGANQSALRSNMNTPINIKIATATNVPNDIHYIVDLENNLVESFTSTYKIFADAGYYHSSAIQEAIQEAKLEYIDMRDIIIDNFFKNHGSIESPENYESLVYDMKDIDLDESYISRENILSRLDKFIKHYDPSI